MKNQLLLGLAIAMIMPLTSCFGGEGVNTSINIDIDVSKDRPVLKTVFPNSGLSDSDFKNGYTAKLINEMTGYEVEYEQLSESGADQNIGNFLSTKKPYNLMKITEGQFSAHVAKGGFMALNDLLDKYGQDLLSIIPESSWNSVKLDDKIFAIPETAFSAMSDCALIFNMEHLKEVGITTLPTTLNEFTVALQKLQERNSSNSSYHAFSLAGSMPDCSAISSTFDLPLNFFENAEGKIQNYVYNDNMMPYVNYMNFLGKEKILAASWSTNTGSDIQNNFIRGNCSVGYLPYWNMLPLYRQMMAQNVDKYPTLDDVKKAVGYTLRLKGDGTHGSKVQEKARFRTDIGNAYYIAIPTYMGETAAYAIDYMNTKIKAENYDLMYAGREGESYEVVKSEAEGGVKVTINGNVEYRKLLPGFEAVKNNSMYTTGANMAMGKALWPMRESGFDCWEVQTELDETVIRDPMMLHPILPKFSTTYIAAASFVMTYVQQAINSTVESGKKSPKGIIDILKANYLVTYWNAALDGEVNNWYVNRNK